MKFLVSEAHRQINASKLADCADYCVSEEGIVIMRCPICGTLAYIRDNTIENYDQLTIRGPFTFPCEGFHAFTVINGQFQTSMYRGPDERQFMSGERHYRRVKLKGFDLA